MLKFRSKTDSCVLCKLNIAALLKKLKVDNPGLS